MAIHINEEPSVQIEALLFKTIAEVSKVKEDALKVKEMSAQQVLEWAV